MPPLLRLFLALGVSVAALGATTAPAGAQRIHLLFAGSSSTYWNDLPREVQRQVDGRIAGHGGAVVVASIVGRSGSDIRVYSEPGFKRYEYGVRPGQTFLEKIGEERPELVVLQTVARFIMGDESKDGSGQGHVDAVTAYCEAIRKAGGEPVFYEMGWGKSAREEEGRRRIMEMARRNRIRFFVPCSSAWARVYRERPELALQHPKDDSHPGDLGHFLNLACFHAALVQESPVGRIPRTYHVWPHDNKKPETPEAMAAENARIAAFQPDSYQASLPKWMHRHASMNLTASIDEATARYLETIAWETWQAAQAQLRDGSR